jgi:hypothetical protein
VHLVEAHAFDDAGVVGGEEGGDLEAGLLGHVVQQRLPVGLEVLRGLGRDDAEGDVLRQGAGEGEAEREAGQGFLEHADDS